MKIFLSVKPVLDKALEKRISLLNWVVIFIGVIFFRAFVVQFLAVSKPLTMLDTFYEFIHNLYFFSIIVVLIWIIFSLILKIKPQKLAYLYIYSLFFILIPPVLDMLKNQGEVYWSSYLLSSPGELLKQYITVFSYLPSGIVYFGSKIVFCVSVLTLSFIIWILTKNWLKTFLAAILSYSVYFFMGAFPSIVYYFYAVFSERQNFLDIQGFDVASFFGAPRSVMGIEFPSLLYSLAYKLDYLYFIFLFLVLATFFFLSSREKFMSVVKNMRLPQIVIHLGLFFTGLGLGILAFPENFALDFFSILAILVMVISIWLSWEASVIFNDINDLEIDKITNVDRPLPQGIFTVEKYRRLGIFLFLLSILGAATIGLSFAVLIVIYQIIAWVYSVEPFRLKRFPVAATFMSSLALIVVLFSGFIMLSSDQSINGLSWRIIFLLMAAFTLSLPLKDFKDIAGDKKYRVWTIPAIFGENRARVIIAAGIFISFLLSVFFLNEFKLFWPAIIFGAASYLIVTSKKIGPRLILWPVIGLVFCYGVILTKILFL